MAAARLVKQIYWFKYDSNATITTLISLTNGVKRYF